MLSGNPGARAPARKEKGARTGLVHSCLRRGSRGHVRREGNYDLFDVSEKKMSSRGEKKKIDNGR